MFPRGEAEMYPHTRSALELVAKVIQKMPQEIDISGHTDATRYQTDNGYSNWELSADRANAARRTLLLSAFPKLAWPASPAARRPSRCSRTSRRRTVIDGSRSCCCGEPARITDWPS